MIALSPKQIVELEDAARMGRHRSGNGQSVARLFDLGLFKFAARDRGTPEAAIERAPAAAPIYKLSALGRAEVIERFGGTFVEHACGLFLWSRSTLEKCPQCSAALPARRPVLVGEVLRADEVIGPALKKRVG